jgi:hypothetical protein
MVPKAMHSGDDRETQAGAAEDEIRAALSQHWAASDANDFATEHRIYRDDAILDYPQSGERIRGRANIQTTRALQPSTKHFKIQRIIGSGDVWITEYIIYYDNKPFHTVSIMEFRNGKVVRETQYFAEPFEASAWRSQFVEQMEPAVQRSTVCGR